jgi:hypothetical protein
VTLGYSKLSPGSGSRATWVPRVESAEPVRGFYEPHRNPTASRHGAYPHRNPTDETAHSGTLVMLKARKQPVSSAHVSSAVGAFPGRCSRGDRAPGKRKVDRQHPPTENLAYALRTRVPEVSPNRHQ